MAQTPVRIKKHHSSERRISCHRDELVKVQKLYIQHRYKRCISLCGQLQRPEIHALHQAFLWFYHAVCYESMGLISHDCSVKKVRFLETAQESFKSARGCLPLPYVSTEHGYYCQPEISPPYGTTDSSPIPSTIESFYASSPTPKPAPTSVAQSDSARSFAFTVTPIPTFGSSRSFSAASQDGSNVPATDTGGEVKVEDANQHPTVPDNHHSTHKDRLSQSLSRTHTLANDLVPSPLFSRTRKHAQVTQPDEPTATCTRPLPPLPFNHKSDFEMQGSRVVQVPTTMRMRKTAVQTLIAQYEGTLPLSLPQSPAPAEPSTPSPSPMTTPRFRMIRDAFSPDPHNDSLEAYLSSASLTRYNAGLSDFANQLRKHVRFLEFEIDRVQSLQTERTAARALSKNNRYASFWSFEHIQTTPLRGRGRAPRSPPRHGRLNSGDKEKEEKPDDPAVVARAERVERLRRAGWNVRKDKHGFKGVEWYETLASRAERELNEYEMLRG
ncbi:hypothetical protein LTR67_003157 [Exophiala xenobiotica]